MCEYVCQYVHMSECVQVCQYVCVNMSVCPLSEHVQVYQYAHVSEYGKYVNMSICQSMCELVRLSVYASVSVCPYVSMCEYVIMSIYQSVIQAP